MRQFTPEGGAKKLTKSREKESPFLPGMRVMMNDFHGHPLEEVEIVEVFEHIEQCRVKRRKGGIEIVAERRLAS